MVFKLCWQANKRNFQIRVEMFSSITPLFSLLLCVLTSTTTSYLFRNGKVTHLPRGSTFRKFASNNYELNVKDILLADSYSGLTRAEINEYVIKLEKQNPTVDPAFSPLLNGVWEVVCGGIFSPGLIGYQAIKTLPSQLIEVVNDLTVTISSQAPRVTASTSLKIASATTLDFSVTTDIVAESGMRLVESYESGKLGAIELPLSTIKTMKRELFVTYLDEDLLIARDAFGSPEILRRKEYFNKNSDSNSGNIGNEAPSA